MVTPARAVDRVGALVVLLTVVSGPIALDLADSLRRGHARDAGTGAYLSGAAGALLLALVLFTPAIGLAVTTPQDRRALLWGTAWVAAGVLGLYAALSLVPPGLGWGLAAIALATIAVTTAGAAAVPLIVDGRAPGPPR